MSDVYLMNNLVDIGQLYTRSSHPRERLITLEQL